MIAPECILSAPPVLVYVWGWTAGRTAREGQLRGVAQALAWASVAEWPL